ncbi:hypothetical protein [Nonomuraea sp. LPB2021202275-12-8]|uniref:hypothetical protein n=1 Tax=Nonomuraea sp. LPB2021202275-12-8 TaxID=3120159 RepID=UPI00300D5ECB
MKAQAVRTGNRMAPIADQAKTAANRRVEDARYWAAPRLENAAHRVEDQLAPAVSSMLTTAADRVNPARTQSRRWPMFVLMTGLAVGAVGYMFYRRNAQQWTEHMKDSASDASRWVGEKSEKAVNTADHAGTQVSDKADEASRKMS